MNEKKTIEEFARDTKPIDTLTPSLFSEQPLYKVKPVFRWEKQKLYCGRVLLAEYNDGLYYYSATFEFDDLIHDFCRDFDKYARVELSAGKSIEQAIEELYLKGFELIEIDFHRDGSWEYDFDWDDDDFTDSGDNRSFLIGHAGNIFLGHRYIGTLHANSQDEFTFDPIYFRKEIMLQAKGRLLLDGRLIIPAGVEPRDVVESILRDALSHLNVELIPKTPLLYMDDFRLMSTARLLQYLYELHDNVFDKTVFTEKFSLAVAEKAERESFIAAQTLLDRFSDEPLQPNALWLALKSELDTERLLAIARRIPANWFDCFTMETVIRSGNRELIQYILKHKNPDLYRSKELIAEQGYEVNHRIQIVQKLEFAAVAHSTVEEAMQYLNVSNHDKVLILGGRHFSTTEKQANEIAAFGCAMAFVVETEDGRLVTIPVNDNGPDAELTE